MQEGYCILRQYHNSANEAFLHLFGEEVRLQLGTKDIISQQFEFTHSLIEGLFMVVEFLSEAHGTNNGPDISDNMLQLLHQCDTAMVENKWDVARDTFRRACIKSRDAPLDFPSYGSAKCRGWFASIAMLLW